MQINFYILSCLIVSIIFCLFILFNEYFIVSPTIINTNTTEIIIACHGTINPKSIEFVNDLNISYEPKSPIGIPISNDFAPYIMLFYFIILLNSFVVIPIDFRFANSFERSIMFVVIVLNMLVTPISVITAMNPYKNIDTSIIILFC